mgnify:FL=1
MGAYLRSLERLLDLDLDAILPGHGDVIAEPHDAVRRLIEHRRGREAKVIAALQAHPDATSRELVPAVYADVDPKLFDLAEHSLLAHLLLLEEECQAEMQRGRWRLTD